MKSKKAATKTVMAWAWVRKSDGIYFRELTCNLPRLVTVKPRLDTCDTTEWRIVRVRVNITEVTR